MKPEVIVHTMMSVNGMVDGYPFDIQKYYDYAALLGADGILVGSNTAKRGIESFIDTIHYEQPEDWVKPTGKSNKPIWFLADSRGQLINLLHVLRKFQYARDIVVIITESTPHSYVNYLRTRNYDTILAGANRIDFKLALPLIKERYKIKRIRTDSGGLLNNHLISRSLVDELSILVSPSLVKENDDSSMRQFMPWHHNIALQLISSNDAGEGYLWLRYKMLS